MNASALDRRRRGPLTVAALWSATALIVIAAARYAPSVVATPHGTAADDLLAAEYGFLAVYTIIATVGALVAVKRPGHPVGWVFLVAACLFAGYALTHGYMHHTVLIGATETALAQWAALLSGVLFLPAFVLLLMYLPLVFPDGRLLSPRWRIVVGALAGVVAVLTVAEVLSPWPTSNFPDNPLGVPGSEAVLDVVGVVVEALFFPIVAAIGFALVLRFRRATSAERQQFKWVTLPAGALLIFLPLNELFLRDAGGAAGVAGEVVFFAAFAGLPIGLAIAVLRYRLYAIDRILSRTVTYAALTMVLVGTYVAGVISLGAVVRALTGNESSALIVAASTLAVAALFQPARRRIQRAVDRRFNRAHFDAARTIDVFGQRLRNELDPDTLLAEIRGVVAATLQPLTATVWMPRPSGRSDTSTRSVWPATRS